MDRRKEHKHRGRRIDQSKGDTKPYRFTSEMLITYKLRKKDYIVIVETEKAEQLYQRAIEPATALASEDIFLDIEQGKKAGRADIEKVVLAKRLGSAAKEEKSKEAIKEDVKNMSQKQLKQEAAAFIAKRGKIKLPQSVRDQHIKEKRQQIVNILQKYAVHPETHEPLSKQKIEEATNTIASRGKLHPFRPAEKQLKTIQDTLKEKLPYVLETALVYIQLPDKYSGDIFNEVQTHGTVVQKTWQEEGRLEAKIKIPSGTIPKVKDVVMNRTRGKGTWKVIERTPYTPSEPSNT